MKKVSRWIIGSAAVVVIVIVAGFIYSIHFVGAVSTPHKAPGAIATTSSSPVPSTGLSTFQIVPAQTTASYSVYEDLIIQNKPHNDAIGTTHSVTGSFKIKTGSSPVVTAMTVTVDLRTLQTDSQMRDNYVRRNALQTDTYPYATFVSVSTKGLPSTYSDGQTVHFQLIGNLTMHGKTNAETFDVQGKVVGNTVTGTATSTIYMTDFGIQPPNLANIAIAQNQVVITLNFTAKEA
ncbi:MAG TPA: YceI family protein [Ktedonobacteraceae bacterium]|nr:YceI family protein [Ktedonobacteraceae bacterium]